MRSLFVSAFATRGFCPFEAFDVFAERSLAAFASQETLSPRAACFCGRRPGAVEELAPLDASFGISTMMPSVGDIQDDASEANRIIVTYGSLIVKAADPIDIDSLGQRPPCRLAFSRALCKPCIEIGF